MVMSVVCCQTVRWDRMEMVSELLDRGAKVFHEDRDAYLAKVAVVEAEEEEGVICYVEEEEVEVSPAMPAQPRPVCAVIRIPALANPHQSVEVRRA